ncbi:MAG: protein translocase subunit SecF [Hyphomonadaceae bacterium]
MKLRWIGLVVTIAISLAAIVSIAVQQLNFGLDFTGGVLVEAAQSEPFDMGEVRQKVTAAGFENPGVTPADGGKTAIIRLQVSSTGEDVASVAQKVTEALGEGVQIRRNEAVGPKVSGELLTSGIMAGLLAVVVIAIYVWFRFESKFGWAALITTFHDVLAVVGLFSITRMTFDLTTVAAVLTVAGYSINDTVVVFDRVRETLKKYKQLSVAEIIDTSITATLSRTIMTSGTTLLAAVAMMLLGGPVLFGFAAAISFGILVGTYSSIFVAAPLLMYLPGRLPGTRSGAQRDEAVPAT